MYRLKESAILAYDHIRDHIAKYGYIPFKHTPGMWHHTTQPLTFTLAVDDFNYDQIKDHIAKYGYIPFKHTPGMWHHTTQPLTFTTAVNYFSKQDANHLLTALQEKY